MITELVLFFATFGLCFIFFYFAAEIKDNSELLFLVFFQLGIIFIYLTLHSVRLIILNDGGNEYLNFAKNLQIGAMTIIPTLNIMFWIMYIIQFSKKTAEGVGLIKP